MRKRLKFVVSSILGLCVVFAILAFVPIRIGTETYLDAFPDRYEHSINLRRPTYLIPRELRTSGWPLPGGDFGFFGDPHFFATRPIKIEQVATSDDQETIYAQGFDINPWFSNQRIVEHILAIEDSQGIHEIRVPDLFFTNIIKGIHSLGVIGDQAAFLIPAVFDDQNLQEVLLASWPPRSETGILVRNDDPESWSLILERLRGSETVVVDHLCFSRNKSAISFFRDVTGDSCPDP